MDRHDRFQPISELLGEPVRDRDGVRVGAIAELLVDPGAGRIEYVQIRLHDLDAGHLTVPLSVLQRRERGGWGLPASRETLERLAVAEASS